MENLILEDFIKVTRLIHQARHKALESVNNDLIMLYWRVGEFVSLRLKNADWGEKTVEELSKYIKTQIPDLTGFDRRGLYRMRQFYDAYQGVEFVTPLVTQITWTHHLIIFSKAKTIEERAFYIQQTIKERFTKRELERQINSSLYERTILSQQSLPQVLRKQFPQLEQIYRDQYIVEFLNLKENHSEKELKKALI